MLFYDYGWPIVAASEFEASIFLTLLGPTMADSWILIQSTHIKVPNNKQKDGPPFYTDSFVTINNVYYV